MNMGDIVQMNDKKGNHNNFVLTKLNARINIDELECTLNDLLKREYPSLLNIYEKDEQGTYMSKGKINHYKIPFIKIDEKTKTSILNHEDVCREILSNNENKFLKIQVCKSNSDEGFILLELHPLLGDKNTMQNLINKWFIIYLNINKKNLRLMFEDETYDTKHMVDQGQDIKENHFDNESIDLPYDLHPQKNKWSPVSSITFEIETKIMDKMKIYNSTEREKVFLATYSILINKYNVDKDNIYSIVLNNTTINNLNYPSLLKCQHNHDDTLDATIDKVETNLTSNTNGIENINSFPLQFSYHKGNLGHSMLPWEFIYHKNTEGEFHLHLVLEQKQDKVKGMLYYNEQLFKYDTATRIVNHYITLLSNAVDNPKCKIKELNLLPKDEIDTILHSFNDTEFVFDRSHDATLVSIFEDQVNSNPNAIALMYNNQEITYSQLNHEANKLAHYLKKLGIRKGNIVGVYADRSIEMVISLYAIIKAGAAYLPLDPTHPAERIEFILKDSDVTVILTQTSKNIDFNVKNLNVVYVDKNEVVESSAVCNVSEKIDPSDVAYVIYTSGSTGNPKGVMIQHQGIVNRLLWMQKEYKLKKEDRVLQKTPYTFDVSVWEFFWPLQVGATLVIAKPEGHKDSFYLTNIIQDAKITVVHFVPSMLQLFLDYSEVKSCTSLRLVFCSGEALPFHLQEKFLSLFKGELHNLYGPTEASVDVSYWECTNDYERKIVPIGKPISNIKLYILDNELKPVPIGVPGELHISGVGLAKGYLNRDELNAEKFIKNPYGNGEYSNLYKTGDLARYLSDGNIEYLGRLDFQVKIRGLRIELGEIETLLCDYPDVKECLVTASKDANGDAYLVAYLIEDSNVEIEKLTKYLSNKIPEYMIPTSFVKLKEFPLNSNGKIDRKQLPSPNIITTYKDMVQPSTKLEQKIFNIWSTVLGIKTFSIHDTFVSLGGHSLKAMQVLIGISNELNLDLNLSDLFKYNSVKDLAQFIENNKADIRTNEQIVKNKDVIYKKATLAQERLWFLNELNENLSAYNITKVLKLTGEVDYSLINQTIRLIAARHETLRTNFYTNNGKLYQRIDDNASVECQVVNLENEISKVEVAEELVVTQSSYSFDLKNGPLFLAKIIKLSDDTHWLVLVFHHIIFDGWSEELFQNEFVLLYKSLSTKKHVSLPNLPINFTDYAQWQSEESYIKKTNEQSSYWSEKLKGYNSNFELLTDKLRPKSQSFKGARLPFVIPKKLREELKALGSVENATMYTTLLTSFKVLLYRLTGINDTLIGTPVANRDKPELQNIIGYLVNTLVLRTNFTGNETFIAALKKVNTTTLEALSNQEIPFDKLVDIVNPERDISRNPLFQIAFVLQNTIHSPKNVLGHNLGIESIEVDTKISRFDLTLIAKETEKGLECSFEYNTDLFFEETIKSFAESFIYLLNELVARPDVPIDFVELISMKNKKLMIKNGSGSEIALEKQSNSILELLEMVVEKNYDKLAVKLFEEEMTYKELDKKSNKLAHYLLSNNITKGSKIAVCLNKSIDYIVAILGILKIGAVFIPVDPNYPQERIDFILNDANPDLIISESVNRDKSENIHLIKDIKNDLYQFSDKKLQTIINNKEDVAYIIYTSGSTGSPKGVMVPHMGLKNVVEASRREFGLGENSSMLQFSSISFDASVWEIFMSLLSGASLHISFPEGFLEVIQKNDVTHAFLPPAVLSELINEDVPSLECIITGGEACSQKVVEKISGRIRLFNAYGPTEASICTTIARCKSEGTEPPIGSPIAGTKVLVLDRNLNIVPTGVMGELYIGGLGLAKGYLNRPELDKQSFIDHPFLIGEKLYKTGDMVRFRHDGQLEFLGRKDNQVKIRGLRIELGEIETVINSLDDIEVSIVIPDKHKANLIGFIKCKEDLMAIHDVKEYLQNKLPRHMVPSNIYSIKNIPLTPNGKIDKEILLNRHYSEIENIDNKVVIDLPRNDMEKRLKNIWENILNSKQEIGIHDNYFEIGGQSLSALQVIARIKDECHVNVSLVDFFKYSTISKLATHIADNKVENNTTNNSLKKAPEQSEFRATLAQESLWLLQDINPNSTTYNIPIVMKLTGELDQAALQKSIRIIVERHESLRTVFNEKNGQIVQVVKDGKDFSLTVEEIDPIDSNVKSYIDGLIQTPFNLKEGPLFKANLYMTNRNESYLVFLAHHIIFDGWSRSLLLNELSQLYNLLRRGKKNEISDAEFQFKDYSFWKESDINEGMINETLKYWKKHLEGALLHVKIPAERDFVKDSSLCKHVSFCIDSSLSVEIKQLARKTNTTNYMILFAVVKTLLHKLSGQTDIVVGTPIANRDHTTLESIIGYFVNTLVHKTEFSKNLTFIELLIRVKDTFLESYDNRNVPYEKVIQAVNPKRMGTTSSLFNIMFNMLNLPETSIDMDSVNTELIEDYEIDSKFDLNFYVSEESESFKFNIVYNNKLFTEKRMEALVEQLKHLFTQLMCNPEINIEDLLLSQRLLTEKLPVPDQSLGELKEDTVLDSLSKTVQLKPNNVAIVDSDKSITYKQLDDLSNKVAVTLINSGVGKGDYVALLGTRSVEFIVNLIGVMKTGATFYILNPNYPSNKILMLIQSLPTKLIIYSDESLLVNELVTASDVNFMKIDTDTLQKIPDVTLTINTNIHGKDDAYVLFTSGTTGEPKKILNTHAPLAQFINWHVKEFKFNSEDHFSMLSGLSHDPVLRDIFTPLAIGAKLCIPKEQYLLNPKELRTWFKDRDITVSHMTPQMGYILTDYDYEIKLSTLKHVFFSGDVLTIDNVNKLKEVAPNVICTNFYGATETPQAMSYEIIRNTNQKLTLGKPINNQTQLLILSKSNNLCGIGELGEICIRTPYLSKGYINDEGLNGEKFVQNPFVLYKDIIYKTGDKGYYLSDGRVVFGGRDDNQVKVRGFRIELSEIETALKASEVVNNAVVTILNDSELSSKLVAYLVLKDNLNSDQSTNTIRDHLKSLLPNYMIPTFFITVPNIPVTVNGKVNFKELPDPKEYLSNLEVIELEMTPIEHELKLLWENLLNFPVGNLETNFFDIGGHSLLVIKLMSRIDELFNVRISLRYIFDNPTIKQIASEIEKQITEKEMLEAELKELLGGDEGDYEMILRELEGTFK
jgi:amino acid adenylation domain-containing protein